MSDPNELFDIVDENDVVVGRAARGRCHGDPSLIHRAAHVLVFNHNGDLLLQRRSLNKDIQPDKWDTSVGGHLNCGESYLSAAYREMEEELGLRGLPLTLLYNSQIRNEIESENVQTYLTITDQTPTHNTEEISELRYWSPDEIDSSLGSCIFTPNFEEEWIMFQDHIRCTQSLEDEQIRLCAGNSFPDLIQSLQDDFLD